MRIYKEIIGNRALTASAVNTLSGPDFPQIPAGFGVVGCVVTCTSASFTLADFLRIRMRAGEFLAMDINPTTTYGYLIDWIARFARTRADSLVASSTQILLPFNLINRIDNLGQDACQLPRGRPLQLELQIGSGPVNPTVHIGLVLSNVTPAYAPQLFGWTLNVANGVTNGQCNPAPTNGILQAVGLPNPAANAPTRWKVSHARGGELHQGSPNGLIGSQRDESKFTDTTVIWLPIGDDNGMATGPNELTIEVDTGSTSLSAVEGALWNLVPMVG